MWSHGYRERISLMFPERRQPAAYCVISQGVTEYGIPDCFGLHGPGAGGFRCIWTDQRGSPWSI